MALLYHIYGNLIASELELPELLIAADGIPAVTIRIADAASPMEVADWYQAWPLDDGSDWLRFGRTNTGYLLRFPLYADVALTLNGDQIIFYPYTNLPSETIRHLLLDQVLPLAFSCQGWLVLHASAVIAPHGALAFVGVSGNGKSTLAASFTQCGYPLLTDDCLLMQFDHTELWGMPGYASMRLWEDSCDALFASAADTAEVAHYSSKRRMPTTRQQAEPQAISALYLLDPQADSKGEIVIRPLSGHAAFICLLQYSFKLDPSDQHAAIADFPLLSQIAQLPLLYSLRYDHAYSQLPALHDAILQHSANLRCSEGTRS
jgi:hypothetical protein